MHTLHTLQNYLEPIHRTRPLTHKTLNLQKLALVDTHLTNIIKDKILHYGLRKYYRGYSVIELIYS